MSDYVTLDVYIVRCSVEDKSMYGSFGGRVKVSVRQFEDIRKVIGVMRNIDHEAIQIESVVWIERKRVSVHSEESP